MVMRLSTTGVSSQASNQGSVEEEVDAQVLELYKKVSIAEQRVGDLRQQVPAEIAASIQSELVSIRPPTASDLEQVIEATQDLQQQPMAKDVAMTSSEDSRTDDDEARLPDQESWKQLNEVSHKVPALMAKLDQTLSRLTKIIDLTVQDQSRPSPRTVERVLMNRGDKDGEDDIGATITRRRLANGLA
jgi:hypothetical protein